MEAFLHFSLADEPTASIAYTNIPSTENNNHSSFTYHQSQSQSNGMPRKACKRKRKQKKNQDDDKRMKDEGQIGYVHVRARRGQATDPHSLAEKVRREKISEKMKVLQSIVPGCDKITGKALMLDEVINYVQALQNEVQVLSLLHDAFMLIPHQNMTTNLQQQQMLSFEEHQMISQINGEISWRLEEERQEVDDPFAINSFNSFYELLDSPKNYIF